MSNCISAQIKSNPIPYRIVTIFHFFNFTYYPILIVALFSETFKLWLQKITCLWFAFSPNLNFSFLLAEPPATFLLAICLPKFYCLLISQQTLCLSGYQSPYSLPVNFIKYQRFVYLEAPQCTLERVFKKLLSIYFLMLILPLLYKVIKDTERLQVFKKNFPLKGHNIHNYINQKIQKPSIYGYFQFKHTSSIKMFRAPSTK